MTLDTTNRQIHSGEIFTVPLRYPEDIYVAASLYISAFAHPPFSEECYVEEDRVEGLLSNPEVTAELLQILHEKYAPNDTEDGGEVWEIKKEDFINIYENFEERESTKRILGFQVSDEDKRWIKQSYLESVAKTVQKMSANTADTITLKFDYPTKKILESYLASSNDENSLVMIAGGDKNSQNLAIKVIKRGGGKATNEIGLVTMVGRIRDMGETRESYLQVLQEEMGPYLTQDQIINAFKELELNPADKATFLAEVAKVKGDKFATDADKLLTQEYLNTVVGNQVSKLPIDLIYYTYPNTKTANPNSLRRLINFAVYSKYQVEYTSEQWIRLKDNAGNEFLIAKFHRD